MIMPYVSTFDRTQMMMCSWDSFVDPKSIARLIDAFVNSLDLTKYGVKEAAVEGRPSYDPKGMYKLYIYGSRKGIRSSRKLSESCKVNLEVKSPIKLSISLFLAEFLLYSTRYEQTNQPLFDFVENVLVNLV